MSIFGTRKLFVKSGNTHGFTIIELMISTLIFSVVLLVVTVGVVQFTRSYYQGATRAKTQDTARTLLDSLSQSLQFGVADPSVGVDSGTTAMSYLCAGGYKFIYTKGVKYDVPAPTTSNAGVYAVTSPGICEDPLLSAFPTDGNQLLNSDMRVTRFEIRPIAPRLYSAEVTVVYGDNDLLCSTQDATTCGQNAAQLSNIDLIDLGDKIRCKSLDGSEFCAVASLNTVVKKRIQ